MPPTLFLNWGHRHRTLHHDCLFCSSSNSSASGAKDCIHPRMIPREPPANTWIPDSKISVLAGCNIAFYFTSPVFSPLNPGTWITSLDMLKSLSSMSVTIVIYLCDGKNYENSIKKPICVLYFSLSLLFQAFFAPAINIEHLALKMPTETCSGFHVKYLVELYDFNQSQNVLAAVKLSVLKSSVVLKFYQWKHRHSKANFIDSLPNGCRI